MRNRRNELKKLRLAHVTLSMGYGGIEQCILHLAGGLDHRVFDTCVGCLDYEGELFESLRRLDVFTFSETRRPGLDWRLIYRLVLFFRKERFHIVHTHNQAAHFYAGLAARLARVPILITTEHSRHHIAAAKRRIWEKKFLYSFTDQWVTVSESLAASCIHSDGLKDTRLSVILNGIPIAGAACKEEFFLTHSKAKEALGVPGDAKIIIMVARLVPVKNHALLLRSFAHGIKQELEKRTGPEMENGSDQESKKVLSQKTARGTFNKAHILLAGTGEEQNRLQALSDRLGIRDRVHFLGNRQDIPELLKISDMFVLCSFSEGLPLSLLEAAAARVPVLITTTANRAGFIQHRENGMVVHPEIPAFSKALADFLSPLNQQNAVMAEKSLEMVKSNFSLATMTTTYEQLYLSLARQKGLI